MLTLLLYSHEAYSQRVHLYPSTMPWLPQHTFLTCTWPFSLKSTTMLFVCLCSSGTSELTDLPTYHSGARYGMLIDSLMSTEEKLFCWVCQQEGKKRSILSSRPNNTKDEVHWRILGRRE